MSNDVNLWDIVIADIIEEDRKKFSLDASSDYVPDDLLSRVIADMRARDQLGAERYAKPLTADADADFLKEFYEEMLDATVYLRGWLAKHEANHRSSSDLRGVYSTMKNQYVGMLNDLWMIAFSRERLRIAQELDAKHTS